MGKTYHEFVQPQMKKFKGIVVPDKKIKKIYHFVKEVTKAKSEESHHKKDNRSEEKRFYNGTLGEASLETLFQKEFIDWRVGKSAFFNVSDLKGIGLEIGIKTVEQGKFPVIHKKAKRPEIILIRPKGHYNRIVLCGFATKEVLNTYQDDELIVDKKLRARGQKTGFYGFEHLIPFGSYEELKEIYQKNL